MRVQWLGEKEKASTRRLWEMMFPEDTARFLDYYYKEKTKDNRIVAIQADGDLRAMIHLNPYRLTAMGRMVSADYYIAVSTEEKYRHRGYMTTLLREAMEDGRKKGSPFAFLIPADPAIYEPFGFRYVYSPRSLQMAAGSPCLRRTDRAVKANLGGHEDGSSQLKVGISELKSAGDCREAADLAGACLSEKCELYALRDEAYYLRLSKECQAEDGGLLGWRNREGALKAVLAYTLTQETVEIREPLAKGSDQEVWRTLLEELSDRHPEKELHIFGLLPGMETACVQRRPSIMFRVLDVPVFLECCPGDAREHYLKVKDDFLPENSGCYVRRQDASSGRCRAGRIEEEEFQKARLRGEDAREMSAEELLALIAQEEIFLNEVV